MIASNLLSAQKSAAVLFAMKMLAAVKHAFGRGVFPHQFAWVLELPWRRLVLSPEALNARLPVAPAANVLEVGSGSGYYSVALARMVPLGRLQLFDLQPEMLARSVTRCAVHGVSNVAFAVGDASALPFRDEHFDLVCMVTVLGEVRNRRLAIQAIARTLRPGGVLSVSEHLPDPDFIRFTRLRSDLEPAGFDFVARFGSPIAYTANFRKRPEG